MGRFFRLLQGVLGAFAFGVSLSALANEVFVIHKGGEAAQAQLLEKLERELGAGVHVTQHALPADGDATAPALPAGVDLVVTLGVDAARTYLAAGYETPLLAVMVPRLAYLGLQEVRPRKLKLTAVFIDQPLVRQLELIRAVLPAARRIGVVQGPATADAVADLERLAQDKGLTLVSHPAARDTELYPALQDVLQSADALLALPDPIIVNAATAQNLLLTSFKYRKPVFGYSAAYVRAGALASVYSTPAQIGETAAQRIRELLAARGGAEPIYPRHFSVAVNRALAASLGLQIPDDAKLMESMQRLEPRR